ncbi:MAG: hypothetical protein AB1486_04175 [Planctomycetota bacterium]
MSVLNPTPIEKLVDPQGRPYFLWDMEMTLEQFQSLLGNGDPYQRAYLIGKLMRQAKPDDVFRFVSLTEIRASWTELLPFLGQSRAFWTWLLEMWRDRRGS